MTGSTITAVPHPETARVTLTLDWQRQPDPEPADPASIISPMLAGLGLGADLGETMANTILQRFSVAITANVYGVRLYLGTATPVQAAAVRLRMVNNQGYILGTATDPVQNADADPGYWDFTFPTRFGVVGTGLANGGYDIQLDDKTTPGTAPILYAYTTGLGGPDSGLYRYDHTEGAHIVPNLVVDGDESNYGYLGPTLSFYLLGKRPFDPGPFVPTPPTVSRLDPDGIYRPVRAGNPVLLDGTGWTADDYECPPDVPVTYVATNGVPGDDVPTVAGITLASWGVAWLKSTAVPTANIPVQLTAAPSLTRAAQGGSYAVLGRATPVATVQPLAAARGTLNFYTATSAQRQAVLDLLADGSVLMLAMPGDSDMGALYIAPGDVEETRLTHYGPAQDRLWSLAFVVIDGAGVSVSAAYVAPVE